MQVFMMCQRNVLLRRPVAQKNGKLNIQKIHFKNGLFRIAHTKDIYSKGMDATTVSSTDATSGPTRDYALRAATALRGR